ncbi:hypothetical protein SESBI_43863 [Sesbania bispinosa]|nr:hypothetical protein SESBI_43863 [Sesbania bispinosa]
MARTRCSQSQAQVDNRRVINENLASSSVPHRYDWLDNGVRDANSVMSKDDAVAYMASLPQPPSFELVRPTMEVRVCDYPDSESTKDWFYMYDYCLTTLGVWMPFSIFEIVCNYVGVYLSTTLFLHLFHVQRTRASKGKDAWKIMRNAYDRKLFKPQIDTYRRKNFSFLYEF